MDWKLFNLFVVGVVSKSVGQFFINYTFFFLYHSFYLFRMKKILIFGLFEFDNLGKHQLSLSKLVQNMHST
jgi:hypothetical protein